MEKEMYKAIYRIFNEGNANLFINVGDKKLSLYTPDSEYYTVWDFGVNVNGKIYTVGDLFHKGLGPGSYAELFAGDYDIIQGLTDLICENKEAVTFKVVTKEQYEDI